MKVRTALLAAVFCLCAIARGETTAYDRVVQEMSDLETRNPDLVSTFSIGNNNSGVPILALRISTQPATIDPLKIGHLIVATHHGDERHAPILAMHIAQSLVVQYRAQRMLQGRLPDTEWTILPVLNISGYNANTRNEYRQDSNRDYPGPCNSGGMTLGSIQSLSRLLQSRNYTATATIHGYLGTLTYPWGFATSKTVTLDDGKYETLLRNATQFNRYPYGRSGDLVYPAFGTYEDWVYWKHGVWSILVELKTGSVLDLVDTTDTLLTFFEQVDSSPSAQNIHQGNCLWNYAEDLHLE